MSAPAGNLSLSMQSLRTLLSNCTQFQTWTATATAEAALERIFYEGLPLPEDRQAGYTKDELAYYRPYAVISTLAEMGFTLTTIAAGSYEPGGVLTLWFEQSVAEADMWNGLPVPDKRLSWKNTVGLIIDELASFSADQVAGYLAFDQLVIALGPDAVEPQYLQSFGAFQWAGIQIKWTG